MDALLPACGQQSPLRVIVTIEKLNADRILEIESCGVKVLTVQEVEVR